MEGNFVISITIQPFNPTIMLPITPSCFTNLIESAYYPILISSPDIGAVAQSGIAVS
jgi:hypothetical protein